MNAQPTLCPTPEQLAAFGLGKLHETAAAVVAEHVADCTPCRQTLEGLPGDTFLGMVRAAKAPGTISPSTPTPTPKGQTLNPTPAAAPLPELPPELAKHEKYRILRELGRGGMGTVYLAVHIQMERPVAIKVINKSILERPQALERFAQEVRAAAKLSHPNIVAAYDFEKAGDLHMLVMEFVAGQNLGDIVEKKGPLPIVNGCHYVRQAALGLQHAFEKGMVHRDLKPQNLMLGPKSVVKLLDMGLARVEGEKTTRKQLTSLGTTMGTPEYMAPEQAMDAAKADIRSDIYSLGCTLYCLLAGQPPFADGTPTHKILGHLQREPQPLTELRTEVPEKLAAVVAKMMAKDPEQRYQKPIEVAQALAPFCRPGAKGAAAGPVAKRADAPPRLATPTMLGRAEEVDWHSPAFQAPPVRRSPKTEGGSAAVGSDTMTADDATDSELPTDEGVPHAPAWPLGPGSKKGWLIVGAAGTALLTIGLVVMLASGVFSTLPTTTTTLVKPQSTDPGGTMPPQAKLGWIVLPDLPPDAEVVVNDKPAKVPSVTGKTPEIPVVPGKCQLQVKRPGYQAFSQEINVANGQRKVIVVPPMLSDLRMSRQLRWKLKLDTDDDPTAVVKQLHSLGMIVAFPKGNDEWVVVEDLSARPAKLVPKNVLMLNRIWWEIKNPKAVSKVLAELQIKESASQYVVFLPQEWETKLLEMEKEHHNLREQDIVLTEFEVFPTGNGYDVRVKPKGPVVPREPGPPAEPARLKAPFREKEATDAQLAWAKYLGRKVEEELDLGGGVKLVLVLIPPGTFRMGSPESEKGHNTNELAHPVTITKPFYLGRYAVTQDQYEKIVGKNPSHFSKAGGGKERVKGLDTKQRPVETLSWVEASAFCKAVGKKTDWGTGCLPTEAQWEYACRAGTVTAYFFGDDANKLDEYAWQRRPNTKAYDTPPHAVGGKKPNAFGLYDMHGNVSQWCADCYGTYESLSNEDPERTAKSSIVQLTVAPHVAAPWIAS